MREKLTNKLGLKIISLFIAVGIWGLIVSVDNPVITRKFENISVTETNADAILAKGKVYTVTDGNTVDISVTGRRSFVNSLSRNDLVAIADLSKISITGATYIEPQVKKHTNTLYSLELGSVKVMTVELEDKVSQKFPIDIQLSGDIDTGYTISDKQAKPNMITVSGAKSLINKINQVVLRVNVQGRTSSFQKVVNKDDFLVYDNNGDLLDNVKLAFGTDKITVSIGLQKTKEVELKITPVGEVKSGYELKEFEYEPKKIMVSGDEEVLNALSSISYEYDIDGKYEDYEDNLAMSDELLKTIKKYGVSPVDESQVIAISVKIEKLDTRQISVPVEDIDVRNLSPDYKIEFNTPSINVLVQAGQNEIKDIKETDILPYIDLANYGVGNHLITVHYQDSNTFEIINRSTINIKITRK